MTVVCRALVVALLAVAAVAGAETDPVARLGGTVTTAPWGVSVTTWQRDHPDATCERFRSTSAEGLAFEQWCWRCRRRSVPDTECGTSGTMRGYLVQPSGSGPFPAVVVIHENRGLNPYIEDVARRAATEGFLALAPDGLSPVGGYPGNDDDGRTLQAGLDQGKLRTDMVNSARFVKAHALSTTLSTVSRYAERALTEALASLTAVAVARRRHEADGPLTCDSPRPHG